MQRPRSAGCSSTCSSRRRTAKSRPRPWICAAFWGLLGALGAVEIGLAPLKAVEMGVTNKAFDIFEKEIVSDMVMTRIPEDWTREDVFGEQ